MSAGLAPGPVPVKRRDRLSLPDEVDRRRWWILAVLCLSVIVTGLDNTILNVALPTLARPVAAGGVGASDGDLQWIVDAYTLVFAGLLLTAGSLGDRFGRYGALAAGLLIFGVSSFAAAFAGSASALIAGRAAMGVGGAFVMPATLSILANVFTDPVARGRAIALWAASAAVGLALGPIVGGLLLEHFWWGSVLLVNVPIVAIALVAGWWLLPISKDPASPPLDPAGALLSIAGFVVLVWAIIEGPNQGWSSAPVLIGFALALVLLAGFVAWELHVDHPMLDMRFFRRARFSAASAAITVSFMTLSGMVFLLAQYLQSVRGYSPLRAGVLTLGFAVGMLIMSPLAARLVERFGTTRVVAAGMTAIALSMLLVLTLDATTPAWVPALVALVVSLGFGTVMAPATESIMGALPQAKAGIGSAVNDTTRQLGAAIGVAVFGSLLASRYRSAVNDRLAGVVPPDVLHEVSRNVQHGIAASRTAPGGTDSQIADAARHAFVSGFHLAVIAGALICLAGAGAVLRFLPARAANDT